MSERTTRHDSTNVEINKASLEWYGTKKSKLARNDSVLNGLYIQSRAMGKSMCSRSNKFDVMFKILKKL